MVKYNNLVFLYIYFSIYFTNGMLKHPNVGRKIELFDQI